MHRSVLVPPDSGLWLEDNRRTAFVARRLDFPARIAPGSLLNPLRWSKMDTRAGRSDSRTSSRRWGRLTRTPDARHRPATEGKRMPPAKKATAKKATTKKAAPRTARPARKATRAAKKTTKAAGARGPRKMSSAHKAALAEGRQMSAVVDRYLSALHIPKQRGRKVSLSTLQNRLVAAEEKLKH